MLKMVGKISNILILGFLFAGCIFAFFKTFKSMYSQELWNKLDPIHDHRNLEMASTRFLFIGDSRIAQWEIPNFVIPSYQRINAGIEGQTSGQVLERAKNYFKDHSFSYVIIQVGINDLKAIGFFEEKKSYIINQTIRNIKTLLELCIDHGYTPIFMTIIPPGTVELKRFLFWNTEVNKAVYGINKEIDIFCKKNNINVFDASKILSTDGYTINKEYEKGCLHINELGYQNLNKELTKITSSLIN